MKIIKRNGVEVDFNPSKILNRIKKQSEGLKVDSDTLFLKVTQGIGGRMKTKEIDDLISQTASGMVKNHPDYSKLGAKICISRLHKEIPEDFQKVNKKMFELGMTTKEYHDKAKIYNSIIQEIVDYTRDYNFDIFGFGKLKSIYLLKDSNGENIERPQHMYIRVALSITTTEEDFKEMYDSLSQFEISTATPTTTNAGTIDAQYASCNLSILGYDSKDSLLDLFNRVCTASSKAEGIGIALHNIRSKESSVGKEGGKAGGLLKYIKIINEGLRFFNQRGKRPGSCAVYLEPWHRDIEDLLDIRKNGGLDELRARDIFTALWVNDLFMEAVINDGDWYLFCPHDIEVAGLKPFYEIFGDEFREEYTKGIELGIGKKISAKELWLKILDSQIETGMPYMSYKDSANYLSNQKNFGMIHSSNLCNEIFENTGIDKETGDEFTAICTLASMVIMNYINLETNEFDFNKLYRKVKLTTRYLNNVVDINTYSTKEGKKGGTEQRAIGIGIQGLADTFAILGYSFTSPEARDLNKKIAETIYFASLEQSMELARDNNKTYKYFEGSPLSEGKFHFDLCNMDYSELSGMWDWETLRTLIVKYGVYNSLTTADMPTASSATLTTANECFEPFNYNIYIRKVLGGEYVVINKHMVRDLEKEGLWSEAIINEIIINDGSIQNIPVIEDWIKEKYKTVYEISQKDLMEMAKDRQLFIDQSQSMNLFMDTPTVGKLTSAHFFAWGGGLNGLKEGKKVLKTGMYYLRSEAVTNKTKHLGMDLTKGDQTYNKPDDIDCTGCSA